MKPVDIEPRFGVTRVSHPSKIETAPEVREHHDLGPDHRPSAKNDREASLSISATISGDHPYTKDELIGRLDEARHYYEQSRYQRLQWMIVARQNGLSFHEIAVVMGITENGARKAVTKAVAQ